MFQKENDGILIENEKRNLDILITDEKSKSRELLKQNENITLINNELTSALKEAKNKYDELETVIFIYFFLYFNY